MIRIHVYSEREVAGQNFDDYLVISIVSPGREHPKIQGTNVHKFQFHDVTEEYFLENQNRIVRPMEKEIAESIVDIAMSNRDCDRWIIHCEAGISRSPGVAIGLAKYIIMRPNRMQLMEKYPCYNKHVEALIGNAMIKRVDEITKGLDLDGG